MTDNNKIPHLADFIFFYCAYFAQMSENYVFRFQELLVCIWVFIRVTLDRDKTNINNYSYLLELS